MIEKIMNEEIRGMTDTANTSEQISEARVGWLGRHVERKSEEGAVMRTWKVEVGGQRNIGIPKLR